MLKGTISKQNATEIILKTFPGSFIYDKEIRIPYQEEGELIQLKCVLTCAKTNVEQDGEKAIPGEQKTNKEASLQQNSVKTELTQAEKDNLKKLMEGLGL